MWAPSGQRARTVAATTARPRTLSLPIAPSSSSPDSRRAASDRFSISFRPPPMLSPIRAAAIKPTGSVFTAWPIRGSSAPACRGPWGSTTPPPFTIAGETNDNKGQIFLDPVFALRIDQAWGSGQFSAALHDSSGGNYTTAAGSLAGSNLAGHPADKWGFAVSPGFTVNNAFGQQGDSIGAQAVYSQGATGYATK